MREAASIIGFIIGLIALVPGLFVMGSGLLAVVLFFPYPFTKKTYSSGAGTAFLIGLGFIAVSIPVILGGLLSFLGGLLAKNEVGWSSLLLSATGIIGVISSCVIGATSGPNPLILALFWWGEIELLAGILAVGSLVSAGFGIIWLLVLLSGILIGTFAWEVAIFWRLTISYKARQKKILENVKLAQLQPIEADSSEISHNEDLDSSLPVRRRLGPSMPVRTTSATSTPLTPELIKHSDNIRYLKITGALLEVSNETKKAVKSNKIKFWKRK